MERGAYSKAGGGEGLVSWEGQAGALCCFMHLREDVCCFGLAMQFTWQNEAGLQFTLEGLRLAYSQAWGPCITKHSSRLESLNPRNVATITHNCSK